MLLAAVTVVCAVAVGAQVIEVVNEAINSSGLTVVQTITPPQVGAALACHSLSVSFSFCVLR
eukprot:COSAG02_NODE_11111_length_1791_cov_1.657210_2_plen_61_part_01